ncbi:PhnB protein [Paenibacillus endophyticus]|uniref:PhnB protein n=1 Tax=Paenibacillus endophyticus TaxID=1294268 RepID=A0A7W5C5U4_9BACL|nr:VOC family protein [Paenibacillus endophyticus]MBB3151742.1 PhnB protein [Paenibacillus endophyticus]
MSLEIYLNFNGNCREAATFYAEVFGSEVTHLATFGDMPPNPEYPLPDEAKSLIMHARVNIMGKIVMFSDVFPGMPFTVGNHIHLTIVSQDEQQTRSLFEKLSEGGKVTMELQSTFWSKSYGQLTDRFGIEWQVSLDSETFEA